MESPQFPVRWIDGEAYGLSDQGVVRRNNEDSFLVEEELGLLVVADGMGGHADGGLASSQAIQSLREHLALCFPRLGGGAQAVSPLADPDQTWPSSTMPAISTMFEAIDTANRRIYQENVDRGLAEGGGMGTTLVGLWICPVRNSVVCFHVGDSRLYRWRAGVLEQLTRDHSAYQDAVDQGMTVDLPPRNMLTQAIGPHEHVHPDVRLLQTAPGDVFMLCSDGVHGAVPAEHLAALMEQACAGDLTDLCQQLLELAIRFGSVDNATVILARRDALAGVPVIPL